MKSPIHSELDLIKTELDPGLASWYCPRSEGHWIPAPSYWQWHSQLPTSLTQDNSKRSTSNVQSTDNDEQIERPAILCPESNCLLVRYRVGGLGIYIDRSPLSGGIWLEKGAWNLLKENTLHASLHEIFTTSYQKRILREEAHAALMHKFYTDLGEDVAEDLMHLAEWLKLHPKKRRIIAWLHEQLALDEKDIIPINPHEQINNQMPNNSI